MRIYNSRNYLGLIDIYLHTKISVSTTVEIIQVLQTPIHTQLAMLSTTVEIIQVLQTVKEYIQRVRSTTVEIIQVLQTSSLWERLEYLQQQKLFRSYRLMQINQTGITSTTVEIIQVLQTTPHGAHYWLSTTVEIIQVLQTKRLPLMSYGSTTVEIIQVLQTATHPLSGGGSTTVEIIQVLQTFFIVFISSLNLQQQKLFRSYRRNYYTS